MKWRAKLDSFKREYSTESRPLASIERLFLAEQYLRRMEPDEKGKNQLLQGQVKHLNDLLFEGMSKRQLKKRIRLPKPILYLQIPAKLDLKFKGNYKRLRWEPSTLAFRFGTLASMSGLIKNQRTTRDMKAFYAFASAIFRMVKQREIKRTTIVITLGGVTFKLSDWAYFATSSDSEHTALTCIMQTDNQIGRYTLETALNKLAGILVLKHFSNETFQTAIQWNAQTEPSLSLHHEVLR